MTINVCVDLIWWFCFQILNEIVEKLKAIKNNKKVTYDESLFEQV